MATHRIIFNRRNRLNRDGKASVLFEIYFDRKTSRQYYDTGITIEKEFWDESKKRVSKKHTNANQYNQKIIEIDSKLTEFELSAERNNLPLTYDQVSAFLNKRHLNELTLVQFIKDRIDVSDSSDDTKKHYRVVLKTLQHFCPTIALSDVRSDFANKFADYLSINKKGKKSSVWTHHKELKKFLNEAVQLRLMKHDDNPYNYFSFSTPNGRREYLDEKELEAIENISLPSDHLKMVRDLFVFCAYTGFHHKELLTFKKSHIREINGSNVILKTREKTGEITFIPILSKAQSILKNLSESEGENVFRVISDQKINSSLKVIAEFAKIKRNLTLNMARHTFATTVTLSNGVSKEALQKMMGHTSVKTTEHYARIVGKKISDEMAELQKKLDGDSHQRPAEEATTNQPN